MVSPRPNLMKDSTARAFAAMIRPTSSFCAVIVIPNLITRRRPAPFVRAEGDGWKCGSAHLELYGRLVGEPRFHGFLPIPNHIQSRIGSRFIYLVILNRRGCEKTECANLEPFPFPFGTSSADV